MYLYSLAGLGLQYLDLYQYSFSYFLDPDVLVQPGWSRAAVPRPVPVQFSYLLDPDVLVQPGGAGAAVPQPVPVQFFLFSFLLDSDVFVQPG